MNRTLEQRLKFDHGLAIGQNLVDFTLQGRKRRAVVDISARGVVRCLPQPEAGDMYSCWFRVNGDSTPTQDGGVIVWGARDPEIMSMFYGEPRAEIEMPVPQA